MRSILEDIKNHEFRQVYLLYGPEKYLRNQYRRKLTEALLPDGKDMNFHHYEGKNAEISEIISQAETMPFFADRRVILTENSGFFKGKADQLADYMAEIPEFSVLIFSEDEIDKRGRLFKAVQKHGHAAEFVTQDADTLTRWVLGRLKKEGRQITRDGLEHFLSMTGTDMSNISSELEKLLSYTLGRDAVTREDIDAVCVPQVSSQIFDMVRAVAEHQEKKALDLYYDLLALKEQPMRILFLLAREFNQILLVKELQAAHLSNKEIASKAGIPVFAVGKYGALGRRYTSAELRGIIEELTEDEEAVKTGRLGDILSVELAICRFGSEKPGIG